MLWAPTKADMKLALDALDLARIAQARKLLRTEAFKEARLLAISGMRTPKGRRLAKDILGPMRTRAARSIVAWCRASRDLPQRRRKR